MGKLKEMALENNDLLESYTDESTKDWEREDWQRINQVGTGKSSLGKYYIEDEPYIVKAHERKLADYMNENRISSKAKALLELVLLGLEKYEEDKEKSYQDMTPAQRARYIIEQKSLEYQERWSDIDNLYATVDFETFKVFLEDNNIDLDEFHDHSRHAFESRKTKNSTRIKDWLRQNLKEDAPTPTSTIRSQMEAQGIIDESDKEWANVRKIASRLGVTSCTEHAHWQWTQEAKIKYYNI